MRRVRILGIALLVIGGAIALHFAFRGGRGPVVEGKRMSRWVEDLASPQGEARKRAWIILTKAAPDSVPYLVEGLKKKPDFSSELYRWFYNRFSEWLPKGKELKLPPPVSTEDHLQFQINVLKTIGPEAAAAAPALARIVAGEWEFPPSSLIDRSQVRAEAASALSEIEVGSDEVVEALLDGLKDRSEKVRRRSAAALGKIPEEAEPTVPRLVELLKLEGDDHQDDDVKWEVAETLGRIGGAAKAAVPALRGALKNEDVGVQRNAAMALWRITGNTTDTVPVLTEMLRKKGPNSEWIVFGAAKRLGRMGRAAKGASESLRELLDDSRALARVGAAWALWRLGEMSSDRAVPELRNGLRPHRQKPWIPVETTKLIGELGEKATHLIPDLVRMLKNRGDPMRTWAASALGDLGGVAQKAVPALEEAADDNGSFRVSRVVKAALEQIKGENARSSRN